jgi:phosphopantetheinyl transferase
VNAAFVFLLEDPRPGYLRARSGAMAERLIHGLCNRSDLRLHKDAGGRPMLPGSGLHVSLTHSGSCLAVALASREVGVDIEYIRDPHRWLARYLWITDPAERHPDPSEQDFLACWTGKEAILKMLPGGFDFGPERVILSPARSDAWSTVAVDDRRFFLRCLPPWQNMAVTVALDGCAPVLPFLYPAP